MGLKKNLESLQQKVKDVSDNYKVIVESKNQHHLDIPEYEGEDEDFMEING